MYGKLEAMLEKSAIVKWHIKKNFKKKTASVYKRGEKGFRVEEKLYIS